MDPTSKYDAAALAARYVDSLIGWWLPAGVKPPVRRPADPERDAEQRWEDEGGSFSR